jgi:hypothetical protein
MMNYLIFSNWTTATSIYVQRNSDTRSLQENATFKKQERQDIILIKFSFLILFNYYFMIRHSKCMRNEEYDFQFKYNNIIK